MRNARILSQRGPITVAYAGLAFSIWIITAVSSFDYLIFFVITILIFGSLDKQLRGSRKLPVLPPVYILSTDWSHILYVLNNVYLEPLHLCKYYLIFLVYCSFSFELLEGQPCYDELLPHSGRGANHSPRIFQRLELVSCL